MNCRSRSLLPVAFLALGACEPAVIEKPVPVPSPTEAKGPVAIAPTRIYGRSCYSQETGDVSGTVLTITPMSGDPEVGLKVCEGECRDWPVQNAKLTDGRVTFDSHEDMIVEGKRERRRYRFTVSFEYDAAVLSSVNEDGTPFFDKTLKLKDQIKCRGE
jgi:hypothetical protein